MGDDGSRSAYRKQARLVAQDDTESVEWLPADPDAVEIISMTTVNTFGGWEEIISSVSEENIRVCYILVASATVGGTFEIEIGVGAGGSEVAVARMRLEDPAASGDAGVPVYVPCPLIPTGSRVAVRARRGTDGACSLSCQFGYKEHTGVRGAL